MAKEIVEKIPYLPIFRQRPTPGVRHIALQKSNLRLHIREVFNEVFRVIPLDRHDDGRPAKRPRSQLPEAPGSEVQYGGKPSNWPGERNAVRREYDGTSVFDRPYSIPTHNEAT